jgi:hypothetical protein
MQRMTRNSVAAVLMFIVLIVAVVSMGAEPAKEKAAVAAAEKWLALVDGGKYGESWKEAAAYFRGAITQEKWDQSLQAVRKPLGKMVSRKVAAKDYQTTLPGAPDGQYVVILFETSFENKKDAIETVTPMLDRDGKWRVSGYYIR